MKTGVLIIILLFILLQSAWTQDILFREEFEDLDRWLPLTFPKIDRHSRYETITEETTGRTYVEGIAEASASGLIMAENFDVYKYPVIRWRWNIDHILPGGDARSKEGDDYSLRIYILFKYNPDLAGLGERIQYETAKLLYGEYPPLASVNYIWSNRNHREEFFPNPYTKRAMMFPLRQSETDAGRWIDEEVNALEDYIRAFGKDPPREASLAIMVDTDNTGESTVGRLDFIEVSEK